MQVYVPDESEERVARAHARRSRLRMTVLGTLLALAVVAYVVFGPGRAEKATLAEGFRSEVVPPVPVVGPSDSAWASRRAPFRIQVAVVDTRDQASAVATKLRVDGWRVDIIEESSDHRFRVEVGPYVNRSEAQEVTRKLRSGFGSGVILVERQ